MGLFRRPGKRGSKGVVKSKNGEARPLTRGERSVLGNSEDHMSLPSIDQTIHEKAQMVMKDNLAIMRDIVMKIRDEDGYARNMYAKCPRLQHLLDKNPDLRPVFEDPRLVRINFETVYKEAGGILPEDEEAERNKKPSLLVRIANHPIFKILKILLFVKKIIGCIAGGGIAIVGGFFACWRDCCVSCCCEDAIEEVGEIEEGDADEMDEFYDEPMNENAKALHTAADYMEDPEVQEQMQRLLEDPDNLEDAVENDLELRALRDSNPLCAELMQDPETMKILVDPDNLRALGEAPQLIELDFADPDGFTPEADFIDIEVGVDGDGFDLSGHFDASGSMDGLSMDGLENFEGAEYDGDELQFEMGEDDDLGDMSGDDMSAMELEGEDDDFEGDDDFEEDDDFEGDDDMSNTEIDIEEGDDDLSGTELHGDDGEGDIMLDMNDELDMDALDEMFAEGGEGGEWDAGGGDDLEAGGEAEVAAEGEGVEGEGAEEEAPAATKNWEGDIEFEEQDVDGGNNTTEAAKGKKANTRAANKKSGNDKNISGKNGKMSGIIASIGVAATDVIASQIVGQVFGADGLLPGDFLTGGGGDIDMGGFEDATDQMEDTAAQANTFVNSDVAGLAEDTVDEVEEEKDGANDENEKGSKGSKTGVSSLNKSFTGLPIDAVGMAGVAGAGGMYDKRRMSSIEEDERSEKSFDDGLESCNSDEDELESESEEEDEAPEKESKLKKPKKQIFGALKNIASATVTTTKEHFAAKLLGSDFAEMLVEKQEEMAEERKERKAAKKAAKEEGSGSDNDDDIEDDIENEEEEIPQKSKPRKMRARYVDDDEGFLDEVEGMEVEMDKEYERSFRQKGRSFFQRKK